VSTVSNNSVAWSYRAHITGDGLICWWENISSGAVNAADYGQTLEIDLGGGDYFQLYTEFGTATPQYRRWHQFGGDGLIRSAGTFIGTWLKHMLRRVGTTWTLYIAEVSDTSWTQIYQFTSSAATPTVVLWGSVTSFGSYIMPGSSKRSFRAYNTAHSLTDALDDLDSHTATLANLAFSFMEGASPTPADYYLDQSGNGLNATPQGGSPTTDSSDPITSSGISEAAHTERLRMVMSGFAASYGVALQTERARFVARGASLGIGVAANTERLRQATRAPQGAASQALQTYRLRMAGAPPATQLDLTQSTERLRFRSADFSASLATSVSAHTERLRLAAGEFAVAVAALGHSQQFRMTPAGATVTSAAALQSETLRMRAEDFTPSAASLLFAHTERLQFQSGGAVSAMAAESEPEQLALRYGSQAGTLGIEAQSEPWRARYGGAVSALATVQPTGRVRVRDGEFGAVLIIEAQTEPIRMRPSDFTTSGDAVMFAHTEYLRTSWGALSAGLASDLASEQTRLAPGEFSANQGITAATEATEYARFAAGGFVSVLGAGGQSEALRFGAGGLTTAQAGALVAEQIRTTYRDYDPSVAAILFAHTERLQTRWGGVATALAAQAIAGEIRTRDSAVAAQSTAGGHTTALREDSPGATTAAAAPGASTPIGIVRRATQAQLATAGATERLRIAPRDFSTGAVILVSAHTEALRMVPRDATVQLGITGHTSRVTVQAPGLTSQQTGPVLASERLRTWFRSYQTVVGVQAVTTQTEQYRVRFGEFTVQVSVLPVTVVVQGSYGSGPYGSMPYGSGMPDPKTTRRIRAITANAVLVPYEGGIGNTNPRNPNSPLNPRNWAVAGVDPQAQVRLPMRVFAVAAGQTIPGLPTATDTGFILVFDGILTQGAQYRLAVAPAGVEVTPAEGYVQEFAAVVIRCDAIQRDERDDDGSMRDIANPYVSRDALQFPPALGTYQITDSGDLANDDGETSLRKRIIRRVTATVGDFFHLPGYGAGIAPMVKQLQRIDTLNRMAAKVKAQVAKEPEVTQVSVQVRPANGDNTVIVVAVTVSTVANPQPQTVVVPVAL
jgi:hypothetical protein